MDAIRRFWESFRRLEARLVEEGHDLGVAYDMLLEDVQKIEPGLFLEICPEGEPKEFIVTAEGKKELFPIVEEIVRAAPKMDGWKFLALKPRLGFPVKIQWEAVEVRIKDVTFKPIPHPDHTLSLELFVKDLRPEDAEDAHNALLRALDHGLGERAFAEQIQGTQVAPTPGWLRAAGLIPLTELEGYLRKRSTSSR